MSETKQPRTGAMKNTTPDDVCALCYHHKSEATTCNREDCELSSASPCSLPDDWFCDCSDSEIRRIDEDHPHASGIKGPGWFCMGCLTEFVKANEKMKTDTDNEQSEAAVDVPRLVLRLRPRWKRVLMWPLNLWKTFRIGSYRPVRLRVKVASDVANGIVRHNPHNKSK